MIGICSLLLDNNKSPFDPFIDSSIILYKEFLNPYYIQRTILLYIEILKDRKMFKEAATILVKYAGDEIDFKSSLLLEHSGFCYLMNNPIMSRKFIFHLILSGHRFIKCGYVIFESFY